MIDQDVLIICAFAAVLVRQGDEDFVRASICFLHRLAIDRELKVFDVEKQPAAQRLQLDKDLLDLVTFVIQYFGQTPGS